MDFLEFTKPKMYFQEIDQHGPGAWEEKTKKESEAIRTLKKDRTLLAMQLTADAPIDPEVVTGLKTENDFYNHFGPETTVEFTDMEGQTHEGDIKFKSLADFGPNGISRQSEFLMDLQLEIDFMDDLIRQLRSNSALQKVLENADSREAFLDALAALIGAIPD